MSLNALHKYTYREYQYFPSDGNRHEIIDGEHYRNPSPSPEHQTVSRHLLFQRYSQLGLTIRGQVFNAPIDVELAPHDIVQPDLAIILNERLRIITTKRIRGIPNWCVEIVSESNPKHDRVLKLEMYQRCGVPEYWIIDPDDETVDSCVLSDGQKYSHSRCSEKTLRPAFIPDITVDLSKIWEDGSLEW